MAPSNLQGLNIVHPAQSHSDAQDLLSGPPFPDLSAQLDLWTNLTFDSDEGSHMGRNNDSSFTKKTVSQNEEDSGRAHGKRNPETAGAHLAPAGTSHPPAQFDLNTFLAGFGIDPYSAPPAPNPHLPGSIAPSIAQLIALHAGQAGSYPALTQPPASTNDRSSFYSSATSSPDDSYPPAKRTRNRRSSVSTIDSEVYREETPMPGSGNTSTPLSAAEDKRRRNTAASARFRLKKKEREAALEGKAKELEGRVNELERECEGLRRENGWLKGLVVGVTGASQGPAAVQAGSNSSGNKRAREESDHA